MSKAMPISAQKLILRMYTLHELGQMYKANGEWDTKQQLYAGCCNEWNTDEALRCTLAPNHNGPHIAHATGDVVGAWLNKEKKEKE